MKTDFKTDWELGARVFGYSFLFRGFLEEPTKDFLEKLKNEDFLSYFPYINENDDIKNGVRFVESYINESSSIEKLTDELAGDYAGLFLGPGKVIAPPWESVYVSGGGLIFREETFEVRKRYAKHGLLPEKLNKEPDDHVGLELQFMYLLSSKTIDAIDSGDYKKARELFHDQKEFLEEHLLKWSPRFSDDIYHNAETSFYQGIAKVLKGFVTEDHGKLNELSGIFNFDTVDVS